MTSGNAYGEAAVERAIHSLRGQRGLYPVADILLRSEGMASSRIEGEVASTRRGFEAEFAALIHRRFDCLPRWEC